MPAKPIAIAIAVTVAGTVTVAISSSGADETSVVVGDSTVAPADVIQRGLSPVAITLLAFREQPVAFNVDVSAGLSISAGRNTTPAVAITCSALGADQISIVIGNWTTAAVNIIE